MTLLNSCTLDLPTGMIDRPCLPYLNLVSSLSAAGVCLATLCHALAKKWPKRDIVLVVDEIIMVESDHFFSNLDNISGTHSITLILILNPRFSATKVQVCRCKNEGFWLSSAEFLFSLSGSGSPGFPSCLSSKLIPVNHLDNITCKTPVRMSPDKLSDARTGQ